MVRRDRLATLWVQAENGTFNPRDIQAPAAKKLLPGCHSYATDVFQVPGHPGEVEFTEACSKVLLPLSIYVGPQAEVHCGASQRDHQAVLGDIFSMVHRRHIDDIRRLIRANCRDVGLVRMVQVEDIEQDVLVQVLALVRRQPLSLFCDEKLTLRLLSCVVRRVVQQHARSNGRAKRDVRRNVSQASIALTNFACHRAGSTLDDLAARDQVEVLLARLPDHHRKVVRLRSQGRSWEEISSEAGGSADSNRMLFHRAIRSLAQAVAK